MRWSSLPSGERAAARGLLIPPTAAQAGERPGWPTGVERQYCAFDGDSFLGSRGGAKASVDFVYLAPVLDKGVTVRDLCQVTRISERGPTDGGGYVVHFKDLATGTHRIRPRRTRGPRRGNDEHAAPAVCGARQPTGWLRCRRSAGPSSPTATCRRLGEAPAPVSSFWSTTSLGEFTVDGYASSTFGVGGLAGFDTWPLPAFVKRRLEKVFFMYAMGTDSGKAGFNFAGGRLRATTTTGKSPSTPSCGRPFA